MNRDLIQGDAAIRRRSTARLRPHDSLPRD